MKSKKEINKFVAKKGGYFNLTEFDQDLNDLTRKMIAEYITKYPEAHLVNLDTKKTVKAAKVKLVHNFEYNLIVDSKQSAIIATSFNNLNEKLKVVDQIFDGELTGEYLNWV